MSTLQEQRNQAADELRRLGGEFEKNGKQWRAGQKGQWDSANERYNSIVNKMGQSPPRGHEGVSDRVDQVDGMQNALAPNPLNLGAPNHDPRQMATSRFARGFVEDHKGDRTPILAPNDSFAMAAGATTERPDEEGIRSAADYLRTFAVGPRTSQERNSLSETSDPDGGYTVPTILSSQLIDLMRSKSRIMQAGASTIGLTTERTDYARVASDPVPGWRLELGTVAESQPSFDKITFQARSLAVLVKASQEILEDSVNIANALPNLIATALAQEVDRVALLGSGTAPEPTGVFNFSGVQEVSLGTDGAFLSDASVKHGPFLSAELALQNVNVAADAARPVITSPGVIREINLLADTTGQPLMPPPAVANWNYLSTTKVPTDVTQGTNNDTSWAVTGKWDDLILGMRRNIRLQRLTERYADTMEVGFLASLRMDVGAWRENSFVKVIGIRQTP